MYYLFWVIVKKTKKKNQKTQPYNNREKPQLLTGRNLWQGQAQRAQLLAATSLGWGEEGETRDTVEENQILIITND